MEQISDSKQCLLERQNIHPKDMQAVITVTYWGLFHSKHYLMTCVLCFEKEKRYFIYICTW